MEFLAIFLALILLLVILPALLVGTVALVIKPHIVNNLKFIKKPMSRLKIGSIGAVSMLVVFVLFSGLISVDTDAGNQRREAAASQLQAAQKAAEQEAERERLRKIEAAKPKVETETKRDAVPYDTVEQEDGSIPRGETRVANEGIEGVRAITYEVTYVNGKETDRRELSNEVTVEPIAKVVLIGTYVAPPPVVEAPPSSGNGYVNSQGNFVSSPSDNPAGATAKCRNGTYSYSQSRRGTCSHHGGVAEWL